MRSPAACHVSVKCLRVTNPVNEHECMCGSPRLGLPFELKRAQFKCEAPNKKMAHLLLLYVCEGEGGWARVIYSFARKLNFR